ncbi:TRAP transporter large permease [Oceanobacillus sojae]|uniref:TRAP transporter large permease n=1 Tax=Oceanobacillus sojae TaxID=582851 RepID=UPI0009883BE3|nr:TRAP transporter large permease [Oceanobacillus sojae]
MEVFLIIAVLLLIILLIIGVPAVFAFLAATIFLVMTLDYDPSFLLPYGYSQLSSTVLLAIPLFIIAGKLMEYGGIGNVIIGWAEILVGKIKGGLGIVTIFACAIFGSISGSAMAALSTIGSIMFKKLDAKGYPRGYAAALVSNASILGLLIPPSGIMILYAWLSNQSVLASFLSTIVPGLILITLLSIINILYMRKRELRPEQEFETDLNRSLKYRAKKFGIKTFVSIPGLVMPVLVLGGIYSGIMTTTEAAAVAAFYAIPVGFWVYKGLKLKDFKTIFINAATTTGIIMVMVFAIMILSRIYVMENIPNLITEALFSITENTFFLIIMLNIFMIIIGMLMDDVSGVLLTTPILLPIITNLGVDPIHFAAILAVNLGMGNITPPTAPLLYFGGQLAKAPINEMIKPTLIIILFAWLPTLLVVTYIPEVALFLPNLLLK